MGRDFKSKLVVAVIVSFFIFQLFLFVKSFPAEYNLYLRFLDRLQVSDPFWTWFWFASELVGEVGLFVRFAGACFALAFAWFFAKNGEIRFSYLRKAVLFEGAYYLFIIPFIASLFTRPNTSIVNVEAGLSYTLQIAFITIPFVMLYFKMKNTKTEKQELYRWGAIAIVGYTFALWVKHFLLNLYALPINIADVVQVSGLLNSILTLSLACLILLFAFLPIIQKRKSNIKYRALGIAFLLLGTYFIVYVIISFLNQRYMSFITLTELWAISFLTPGIGFCFKKQVT